MENTIGDLSPEERQRQRQAKQDLENKRLGLLIFQGSWMMAFVALIIVNWQLRFQYASWPPPGVEAMGVALPTLATILLFVSVVLARRAQQQVKTDQLDAFIRNWWIVIGLGGGFVTIMAVEWFRVPTGTQYSAVFRLMTLFHSLHAVAVGAYMVNILRNARHAQQAEASTTETVVRYDSSNFWPVEAASKLWDFVAIAWILFYIVLYWWRS